MRHPSVGGGLLALKASGDSTSTDDLICFAMVLAGGVDDIVGWKAKALGWNQKLYREKAAGITFPLAPCLCCYSLGAVDHPTTETFTWVGGRALPCHVYAIGKFNKSYQIHKNKTSWVQHRSKPLMTTTTDTNVVIMCTP